MYLGNYKVFFFKLINYYYYYYLGYLVSSGLRNYIGSLGLRVKVQSEKDTVHLENRIEAFLNKLQV